MADSSDEEHPYVKYGTPLQELSELSVKPSALKNTVPIFEQVVTDDAGRRRFHGAFTGGFSAGYYNTVGTKEGWKPSTFKSSRSNKSERKLFKAADFMDEEDMGDFGIAPKMLSTKEEFTAGRKRIAIQEKQQELQEARMTLSLGSDLMESLVVPVRSNIGIKLLRNMGWKEGQGLGPHVVRRKKKKKKPAQNKSSKKIYGCRLPGDVQDSDSDDEHVPENFKFAPKDMMPVSVMLKDDRHGIGYSGLDPNAALHKKVKKSTAVKAKTKTGNKLSFYGQAFGVGAYEEEDEDIYAQDSMSNYDAVLGNERNPDDTYGWTKPLAITGSQAREAIGFGDSLKVLFVAAVKQSKLYHKVYPPPNIPPDFDPYRRLRLKSATERINKLNLPKTNQSQIFAKEKSQSHLMSEDRRSILGEKQLPESPKKVQSVFDFISWEDRQKMEAAKRKPVELGYKGDASTNEKSLTEPSIDRSKPLCKPTALKPFSDNPEKLRRYEQYEKAIRERRKDPYSTIQSNLTEWERKHERDEFAKMSQVYLHLSTNINSRFTKPDESTSDSGMVEGLNKTNSESSKKVNAFGIMTHTSAEWHPDPLLCKRFNVPDPYPDSDIVGSSKPSGSKYLSFLSDAALPKNPPSNPAQNKPELKDETGIVSDTLRPPAFEKSRPLIGGRWDKKPAFVGPLGKPDEGSDVSSEKQNKPNENAENIDKFDTSDKRPPMELFKSIFASSEEESSSDDEEDDDVAKETKPVVSQSERLSAADVFTRPLEFKETERITNVPAERFSAADVFTRPFEFKETERLTNVSEERTYDNPPQINPTEESTPSSDDAEDIFGPALPPPKPANSFSSFSPPIEAKTIKSHKSHSKHKKHKKHDHKHKKKKKH